jgi:peroxiredoxin
MAEKISKDDGKPPGFVFLSDPGHRMIDRYGLLNPDGRGWPHPTTLVIDRQGIVRWKSVEVDYKIRPSNEQILEALGRLSR